MKRFFAIVLVVLMVFALSGCCLKHDMQPATCTQPSTCSKCGKTEGEALGHTAVDDPAREPTCTETGLTAGKHCSVCGEVLQAQEEIPALGHAWEEATFSRAMTCRVCGETEGEPLGAEFFVRVLNPEKWEAEDDTPDKSTEPGEAPTLKVIRIDGTLSGFDELDEIINSSALTLTVDKTGEDEAAFRLEAAINAGQPINVDFTADEKGVFFTLPGITDKTYYASFETLKEVFGEDVILPTDSRDAGEELEAVFSDEELQEMLLRYERIFFSVFTPENTSEEERDYTLETLGETLPCTVLTTRPSAREWHDMLAELLKTAAQDEQLKKIVETAGKPASMGSPYPADPVEEFYKALNSAYSSLDETARSLAKFSVEFAWHEGRLHAVGLYDDDGESIGYESFGEPAGQRRDVITYRDAGGAHPVAESSFSQDGDNGTGKIEISDYGVSIDYSFGKTEAGDPVFDIRADLLVATLRLSLKEAGAGQLLTIAFDGGDTSAEIRAHIADGEEHVVKPDSGVIELRTMEDFQKAAEEITEKFAPAKPDKAA